MTITDDAFLNKENITWDSKCDSNINNEEYYYYPEEINEDEALINKLNVIDEIVNKTESTIDKTKNEYIPFKFEWKDEENSPNPENNEKEVMITGTFLDNWNTIVPMIKNPETNVYEFRTSLTKSKHFFKYIINNKWKCSNLYPTAIDDANNLNNYIDLTKYSTNISKKNKKQKENNNINLDEIYTINSEGYDLKYPLIKDLNTSAPGVIPNYKNSFCLDYQSNQKKFDNIFLPKKSHKSKNSLNLNNCYKKIFNCSNEKLEHLIENIEDILSSKRYIRYSITQRKIDKLLTLVYYKPK